MTSTPSNTSDYETRPTTPSKVTEPGVASIMPKLEESRNVSTSFNPSIPESTLEIEYPDQRDNDETNPAEGDERRRREEEESIALARALMAEEAMAVSYHMSADYLRNNRDQFSEEDLAALQAAMDDGEAEAVVVEEEEDGGMSYEMMLRLGEQLGDVKSERWSRIAREKISQIPTFRFKPESVEDKDENDCDVKCLVCQYEYEKEECLRRLRCGHCFHRDCVDQWLQTKDFCPYCRKSIVDEGDN